LGPKHAVFHASPASVWRTHWIFPLSIASAMMASVDGAAGCE
jgi:hypothetical protein